MTMETLVTMTISASRDNRGNEQISDSTQTHGNDWAKVYVGMVMIRDELNRQLEDRRRCPFNPANIRKRGAPDFDEGGDLPEAHADPCTCLATIDNHPLTPKLVDDRGMGVQVTQTDWEAANCLEEVEWPGNHAAWTYIIAQAFARHREQAERGLRDALEAIAEITKRQQLPITSQVHEAARKALDARP